MNGREVYRFAVNAIVQSTQQALAGAGLSLDEIDLFIPHQANVRIIQAAMKALRLPPEKMFVNVERYGNTSAASVPIALCEAVEQGRIHAGSNLALIGFGAGLTWATAIVHWGVEAMPMPRSVWRTIVRNVQTREAGLRSFAHRTHRRIEQVGHDAMRRLNGENGG
jgi:3-oxoacyl-[acyl-carrier-protein] synthase-3